MFDKLWKIVAALVVIGLVAGLVLWLTTRERKREMTPLMEDLAAAVSVRMRQEMPRTREIDTMLLLVVGRGNRDEEEQFRQMLVEAIIASDKYRVKTWDDVQEVLDDGGWVGKFIAEAGLVPGEQPSTIETAVKALKYLETANLVIDGILLVEVTSFTEGPNQDGLGAKIAVEGKIYSHKSKKVIETFGPYSDSIESRADLRWLSYTMGEQSLVWRFPLWFALSCGLPWALIGVVRAVVRRKDNVANLGLLAVLTVIDLLLAWIILLAFGTGAGTIVGLLFVAGLMAYYNYDAVDYIERRLL